MSAFVTIVSLVSQLSLNEKQALVALLGAPAPAQTPAEPAKTTKTTKTKKQADPSKPKTTRKPSPYNKWYKANFASYRSTITGKDASLKGRPLIKAIMVEMSAAWKAMSNDAKKKWGDDTTETTSSDASATSSDNDDEVLAEIEEMEDDDE